MVLNYVQHIFPGVYGPWYAPLRSVSVAQKNKRSTILSLNVQSIEFPMDCMTWRFWMRQLSGCSTPALRSSAAKQWIERTGSNNRDDEVGVLRCQRFHQHIRLYPARKNVSFM